MAQTRGRDPETPFIGVTIPISLKTAVANGNRLNDYNSQ